MSVKKPLKLPLFFSSGSENLDKLMTDTKMMEELRTECATAISGKIRLIYGHGGSGKTSVCVGVMIHALKQGADVIFYDTENKLTNERLAKALEKAKLKYDYNRRTKEIDSQGLTVERPTSYKELIDTITKHKNYHLVIIDSITMPYITYFFGSPKERRQRIYDVTTRLTNFTGSCINQTRSDKQTGFLFTAQPKGGEFRGTAEEAIEELSKDNWDSRVLTSEFVGAKALEFPCQSWLRLSHETRKGFKAVLMKHDSKESYESCRFTIDDTGVADYTDPEESHLV